MVKEEHASSWLASACQPVNLIPAQVELERDPLSSLTVFFSFPFIESLSLYCHFLRELELGRWASRWKCESTLPGRAARIKDREWNKKNHSRFSRLSACKFL